MELKKYKLGNIADIINGATPSTQDIRNYDGNIIWITPKDLSDQKTKRISRGQRNITIKGFNSCSAQMIPPHNILMSSRAPIGLLAINENECCTNQGFKNLGYKQIYLRCRLYILLFEVSYKRNRITWLWDNIQRSFKIFALQF